MDAWILFLSQPQMNECHDLNMHNILVAECVTKQPNSAMALQTNLLQLLSMPLARQSHARPQPSSMQAQAMRLLYDSRLALIGNKVRRQAYSR